MSLSRLRRAPERWWNNLKQRSQRQRNGSSSNGAGTGNGSSNNGSTGSFDDTHRGGRGGERGRMDTYGSGMDLYPVVGVAPGAPGGGADHYLRGIRNSTDPDAIEAEVNQKTAGNGGGGGKNEEAQILSEEERREVLSLVKDNNISMDFILEMKEAFLLFDKNGDGFISARELGVLMRTLGRNPTEEEIMNIMNEIDVDHNGKLDFPEFVIMMRDKLSGEDMEQEIRQAFRVFDRNGDGYISKQEFKHCMMHFGERFTNEEVEEMIAEADSNNDGKIDYHEFSKMILSEIT